MFGTKEGKVPREISEVFRDLQAAKVELHNLFSLLEQKGLTNDIQVLNERINSHLTKAESRLTRLRELSDRLHDIIEESL